MQSGRGAGEITTMTPLARSETTTRGETVHAGNRTSPDRPNGRLLRPPPELAPSGGRRRRQSLAPAALVLAVPGGVVLRGIATHRGSRSGPQVARFPGASRCALRPWWLGPADADAATWDAAASRARKARPATERKALASPPPPAHRPTCMTNCSILLTMGALASFFMVGLLADVKERPLLAGTAPPSRASTASELRRCGPPVAESSCAHNGAQRVHCGEREGCAQGNRAGVWVWLACVRWQSPLARAQRARAQRRRRGLSWEGVQARRCNSWWDRRGRVIVREGVCVTRGADIRGVACCRQLLWTCDGVAADPRWRSPLTRTQCVHVLR